MEYHPDRPLVIQSDRTIFVEVNHLEYELIRENLISFSELVKSPEYIHTYRMTPLSLWNAAASGWNSAKVISFLSSYAKFPMSYTIEQSIMEDMDKFGRIKLVQEQEELLLIAENDLLLEPYLSYSSFSPFFEGDLHEIEWAEKKYWAIQVVPLYRGELKVQSIKLGFPIQDLAGYEEGEHVPIQWVSTLPNGQAFQLRDYQEEAADAFYKDGSPIGGQGVLVLPCGAGKTIIGLASLIKLQCATLILTTNTTSVRQWKRELLEKTNIAEELVGEYTGNHKQLRPITIATYHILTHRSSTTDTFSHLHIFQENKWGLIIYDEVHLLPAPIFRATAALQATRRLGLTATLVREDGKEEDVFSLVGPKAYEVPWKKLENRGYLAKALCTEIRVELDSFLKEKYYLSSANRQMRIAQENPNKLPIIKKLIEKHRGLPILVIGQYVDQLEDIGVLFQIPVITGKMKQEERDVLYQKFKNGALDVLAVSKVANFAIDLPDAAVAIQISGMYGSRQEEAQRLGRILRPKAEDNRCYFYNIVTKDTKEQEYALKRQLFLIEQGYQYQLMEESEVADVKA